MAVFVAHACKRNVRCRRGRAALDSTLATSRLNRLGHWAKAVGSVGAAAERTCGMPAETALLRGGVNPARASVLQMIGHSLGCRAIEVSFDNMQGQVDARRQAARCRDFLILDEAHIAQNPLTFRQLKKQRRCAAVNLTF